MLRYEPNVAFHFISQHNGDEEEDDEEDIGFSLQEPLRAEGSTYNAAELIAFSSQAHGVGRLGLLDDRFDLMKEISLPDLSGVEKVKKSRASAMARNEMELLEAELSGGRKRRDKKDRLAGLGGGGSRGGSIGSPSPVPHSPLDRSPSNSRRGSLSGVGAVLVKSPSSRRGSMNEGLSLGLGLGAETSEKDLSLPPHLRHLAPTHDKGRQAQSHLADKAMSYSASVASSSQALGSGVVDSQGTKKKDLLLQQRLSGSSKALTPPHPPHRVSPSQSPSLHTSPEPHGVIDPSEVFPDRPGTMDSINSRCESLIVRPTMRGSHFVTSFPLVAVTVTLRTLCRCMHGCMAPSPSIRLLSRRRRRWWRHLTRIRQSSKPLTRSKSLLFTLPPLQLSLLLPPRPKLHPFEEVYLQAATSSCRHSTPRARLLLSPPSQLQGTTCHHGARSLPCCMDQSPMRTFKEEEEEQEEEEEEQEEAVVQTRTHQGQWVQGP